MTNIMLTRRFRNNFFFFGDASYAEKYNLQDIVVYDTNSKLHFLLLEFTKNVQVCLEFYIHEGPLGKRLLPNLTHNRREFVPKSTKRSHVAICTNFHSSFLMGGLDVAKRFTHEFPERRSLEYESKNILQ